MAILAFDKEIMLSSNLKGDPRMPIPDNSLVMQELVDCEVAWAAAHPGSARVGHKNAGMCAEVMAMHQYYLSRDNAQKLDKTARVGAIKKLGDEYIILSPCGDSNSVSTAAGP